MNNIAFSEGDTIALYDCASNLWGTITFSNSNAANGRFSGVGVHCSGGIIIHSQEIYCFPAILPSLMEGL